MHYKEATPGTRLTGELKCWSMAWSEQGRYAIASFCRKLRRRGDQEKNFPQIQVYDCFQDELVTIIDASRIGTKTTHTLGDILKMESPFLLLDAHPSQETVLLSADNEGLIVVWDILSSEILRVFYERGFHMRLPNLEMQILEGGWSPDGLSFAVSTAFGSFSVYGYGMREFYTQTPVEQFYTSDSSHAMVEDQVGFRVMALDHDQEFHLLDRGTICNFYRLPYMYPLA
jgi:bromodomain and WD repeat domain-containing protein 1/3